MIDKFKKCVSLAILLMLIFTTFVPMHMVKAEAAEAVTIGKIDYDQLTLEIYSNGNAVVYYSLDKSTWIEVDAAYNSNGRSYRMDISWLSNTKDQTLYFKGNMVQTIRSITLPAYNSKFKAKYEKTDGYFIFDNLDDADSFQWRKATDYYWTTVKLDESSSSYKEFMQTINSFLTKGAKLYFRTPQRLGSGSGDEGVRPSKEVLVTIPARTSAPTIRVNSSKLTLNTTSSMEYYDQKTSTWKECSSSMKLEDIAPAALYKNGSRSVELMLRKASTASNPHSKTAYLTIPGQPKAPSIGDSSDDVVYYYRNFKLILQFITTSKENPYQYTIVKPGKTLDVSKASWKTVTSKKIITVSKSSAPEGSIVYVRKKGTDENLSKNIKLELASDVNSFKVKY